MKLFKGLRGFLRRRIPFLRKKKNDKVPQTNEGFEDFDIEEECHEIEENANVQFDAPLPHGKPEEEVKSDIELKIKDGYEKDNKESPKKCVQFPPKQTMILESPLLKEVREEDLNDRDRMTSDKIGDLLPAKNLDKDLKDDDCLVAQKLKSCDEDNGKSYDNYTFLSENIEILEITEHPDNKTEFKVDFEQAFGPHIQEFDPETLWYVDSLNKFENEEHGSKEHFNRRLALEDDEESDSDFDAASQEDLEKCQIDSFDHTFQIFPDSIQSKVQYYKLDPVDDYIDNTGSLSSDEQPTKNVKNKKLKFVLRNRPLNNDVKQSPKKCVQFPPKKRMILDGPLLKEVREEKGLNHSDNVSSDKIGIKDLLPTKRQDRDLEDNDCLVAQKSKTCDEDNEKSNENYPLLSEMIEKLEIPEPPDNKTEFKADFEQAFGPNVQEFDNDDLWYVDSSKKVENEEDNSKEYFNRRLALEDDEELDSNLDAVSQEDSEKSQIDSFDHTVQTLPDSIQSKEQYYEPDPVDDYIDYTGSFSSDEQPTKNLKNKKLKFVIRDRPLKNPIFGKLFLQSEIDNMMYIRGIKDPLKRKEVVRSDVTEFKHVPVWDSSNMKKYYSDGDLLRPTADFSMAFANLKD